LPIWVKLTFTQSLPLREHTPFYDANDSTGRIVNVLYLVKEGLLASPVLYLSQYINRDKADYYRLLQSVRDWEDWLLFMIHGVEETSRETSKLDALVKEAEDAIGLLKERRAALITSAVTGKINVERESVAFSWSV
jgi:Fic family protein